MSEYLTFIEEHKGLSVEVDLEKYDLGMPVVLIEARNVRPDNYEIANLVRFSKVYSWNRRFLELLPESVLGEHINGFPLFDNLFWMDSFLPLEQRINGICLIARKMGRNTEGDISQAREIIFEQIEGLVKHAYGKIPFCGEHYRGPIGSLEKETYPSSLAKLKKLNEYKFNLCLENCYHELWSYDYITEKIFDCFKAKTVPVYLGCYNVEEHIPSELFIDLRRFRSIKELSEYLVQFPDDLFIKMTEMAYEWVQRSTWGDIRRLRNQFADYRQGSPSRGDGGVKMFSDYRLII